MSEIGHPLTGGCGLKLVDYPPNTAGSLSPPHGGVWIETVPACVNGISNAVTPSRGGVD